MSESEIDNKRDGVYEKQTVNGTNHKSEKSRKEFSVQKSFQKQLVRQIKTEKKGI